MKSEPAQLYVSTVQVIKTLFDVFKNVSLTFIISTHNALH